MSPANTWCAIGMPSVVVWPAGGAVAVLLGAAAVTGGEPGGRELRAAPSQPHQLGSLIGAQALGLAPLDLVPADPVAQNPRTHRHEAPD